MHDEVWAVLHRGWIRIDLTEEFGIRGGLENLAFARAYDLWAERFPPGPLWAPRKFCDSYSPRCTEHDSPFVVINHVDRIPRIHPDDETTAKAVLHFTRFGTRWEPSTTP